MYILILVIVGSFQKKEQWHLVCLISALVTYIYWTKFSTDGPIYEINNYTKTVHLELMTGDKFHLELMTGDKFEWEFHISCY
jgi:hypothetical protein